MIVELSDFFNNPSLIEIGPIQIQYYAVTWLMSAIFIYIFLKSALKKKVWNRILRSIFAR